MGTQNRTLDHEESNLGYFAGHPAWHPVIAGGIELKMSQFFEHLSDNAGIKTGTHFLLKGLRKNPVSFDFIVGTQSPVARPTDHCTFGHMHLPQSFRPFQSEVSVFGRKSRFAVLLEI